MESPLSWLDPWGGGRGGEGRGTSIPGMLVRNFKSNLLVTEYRFVGMDEIHCNPFKVKIHKQVIFVLL